MAVNTSVILRVVFLLILGAQGVYAQHDRTELVLFDISIKNQKAVVTNPVRIDSSTTDKSFPVFHPKNALLFYIDSKPSQSAIIEYNIQTSQTRLLHGSSGQLSELKMLPDLRHLSFIITDKKGERSLVKISLEGGKDVVTVMSASNIITYAWMDENVLLTVEKGVPNTLNLLTLRPRKQIAIVQNVGHTLFQSPDNNTFAFVHKLSVDSWSIKEISPSGSIRIISETIPDAEVFSLTPDNKILMTHEGQLSMSDRVKDNWIPLEVEIPFRSVYQITINSEGKKIAIAGEINKSNERQSE